MLNTAYLPSGPLADLCEFVADAITDAARDNELDLTDARARREALMWTLAIMADAYPEALSAGAIEFERAYKYDHPEADDRETGQALGEYVLRAATAQYN